MMQTGFKHAYGGGQGGRGDREGTVRTSAMPSMRKGDRINLQDKQKLGNPMESLGSLNVGRDL